MWASWTSGYSVLLSLVCHAVSSFFVIGASIEDRSKTLSRNAQTCKGATLTSKQLDGLPGENPLLHP
jgi:hypothetical protein